MDARYCSEACKVATEYERRRLPRRLEHLETWQANARMYLLPQQQLDRVQAEIDRAEACLRVLLGT